MVDYNVLITLGIGILVVLFIEYIMPLLSKKGNYYDEIKMALMLAGYAFRDEKVKQIAEATLTVVNEVEKLSLTPQEKHDIAVEETIKKITQEFNIDIDKDALDLIIRIAVSLLP